MRTEVSSEATILIIDDQKLHHKFLQKVLGKGGFSNVVCLGDPLLALHEVQRLSPDLIILDILLDGANGLDVLQDIRNTYYDMPVILCTGYPDFRYDIKSLAADYFVDKNSDLSELKNKIEMALESKIAFMIIPEVEDNIQIMLPVIRKRMELEVRKSAG